MFASFGLYDGVDNAEAAIRTAAEHGGRVFVGVALGEDDVNDLRQWFDDAAFEGLAFVLGARPKRRRRKAGPRE
ncbi:MAG: hypothetical protein KIT84_20165 [Labilithrix sp.]|nr:hypothetical protein [Labilithrix sp.]MCW5813355.1 hypothetical protein [Labilithrix sp.]